MTNLKQNANRPSYSLEHIQHAFQRVENLRMTLTAKQTIFTLGFSDQDVVDAIQALTIKDFYKSMPPISEGYTAWQDVYKPQFMGIDLYIKFQINNNKELILSFKEK